MRFYRTSTKDEDFESFLRSFNIKPASVMNSTTGFAAAILIQAEFREIPALLITCITETHDVDEDSLLPFESVATHLLGFNNVNFKSLHNRPGYK